MFGDWDMLLRIRWVRLDSSFVDFKSKLATIRSLLAAREGDELVNGNAELLTLLKARCQVDYHYTHRYNHAVGVHSGHWRGTQSTTLHSNWIQRELDPEVLQHARLVETVDDI